MFVVLTFFKCLLSNDNFMHENYRHYVGNLAPLREIMECDVVMIGCATDQSTFFMRQTGCFFSLQICAVVCHLDTSE